MEEEMGIHQALAGPKWRYGKEQRHKEYASMPRKPSETTADMSANNAPLYRASRRKVLLDLSNAAPDILDAFLAAAQEFEWQLLGLHYTTGNVPAGIVPAGAIVRSLLPDDPEVQAILKLGAPVVRMGRFPHPLDDQVPAVLPDYAAAGRLAATHLAERGFSELGYVGYKENEVAKAIWEGYQARAKELGCACHLLEFGGEAEIGVARAVVAI
jgi:hypothetical protein